MPSSTRHRRRFLLLGLLLAAATGGYLGLRQLLPPRLEAWVASPGFNHLLSSAVSSALKVEGTFGPMTLEPQLTVQTENFTSTGWPGQAIAGLETETATGRFNPWGVLRSRWEVDLIHVARADFRLRNPDDALKTEDPVAPPRPWYAFLMPSQFFCRWIECPSMDIEIPLGSATVRGTGLHVGAKMIGRNFEYFGRHGSLHFADYPEFAIDALQVYVTREVIDIGYLYLREPASPHSNVRLSARLGQHDDKSIEARATFTDLPLHSLLPEKIAAILHGRVQGDLSYDVDTSGQKTRGQGSLALIDGQLRDWEYLDRIADRSGQPEFSLLTLEQASFDYRLEDDLVEVTNLVVRGRRDVDLQGTGSWNLRTSEATAQLVASRVPVGAYLPPSLAGTLQGFLAGEVSWSWHGTDLAAGRGGGTLSLAGGRLHGFRFQDFLDRFFKNSNYATIAITQASTSWRQDEEGLHFENVEILAPGQAGLRGSARIAPDGTLSGTIFAGLPESSLAWLPEATGTVFARYENGLHWCTITLSGTAEHPRTDFPAQVLHQLEKHPLALSKLALRGLSWWLGDHLRPM